MKFVRWFGEIGLDDLKMVGGKNASLGEMTRHLTSIGVKVPNGFAVTTDGYLNYLDHNGFESEIKKMLNELVTIADDMVSVRRLGMKIRTMIQEGDFPDDLREEICASYRMLSMEYCDVDGNPQKYTDVAVRSSSTAEDLPDASFAGQQETYLNIRGESGLLDAIKSCFASLFTDRALSYRRKMGYESADVTISIGVQKMVRSDLHSAGVAFTVDPDSGFRDVVVINGSWGLGEMVVGGLINPDEYILSKRNLRNGGDVLIDQKLGDKKCQMVYGTNPHEWVKKVPVDQAKQDRFCLDRQHLEILGDWVIAIEDHYTRAHGRWCPIDIEWALDGLNGEMYIVQARPETVQSHRDQNILTEYRLDRRDNVPILSGTSVGCSVASGRVKILHSLDDRSGDLGEKDFEDGDILVTDMTTPDWESVMQRASAIVTNKGSRVCHAAIISREFGVPTIVGTNVATEILKNGQMVTVSCAEGDIGYVYNGEVSCEKKEIHYDQLPTPRVSLMMNLANPYQAFRASMIPNDGVGLLRLEFIINNFIKVHPNALINFETSAGERIAEEDRDRIREVMRGYNNPVEYYVERLSQGIARIALAFYPKPVIVRFSDFKSNEYRNLLGGKYYEPAEENPMLGWRGCSRYYSAEFLEAFKLECEAIKYVRERYRLDNVRVMLPFCRTVEECQRVINIMSENGLSRDKDDQSLNLERLQVYLMCEIPSNAILADDFCDHVDGFSIGSNDLTQTTLGLDRDGERVSHLFDERDPAVKALISRAIETCNRRGVKIGICGQGPSDHIDFAQFLVNEGIQSLSLTPDSIIRTRMCLN